MTRPVEISALLCHLWLRVPDRHTSVNFPRASATSPRFSAATLVAVPFISDRPWHLYEPADAGWAPGFEVPLMI